MKTITFATLATLSIMFIGAGRLVAQDVFFRTGFEYSGGFGFVIEPADMNEADDQVGLWSGDEFPEGIGDILILPDSVGFVPSPYGGTLMVLDRPTGDFDGNDLTGSYFANLSEPIGLAGTEVSFDVGTRRTGGNHEKDYDVVGRDSNGAESFRLRVSTNNNGAQRLGVVTDEGATATFDLPTVVGEDAALDVANMGGFNVDNGPGFDAEIANVLLRLGPDGFAVDFSYPAESTSSNTNAYTTSLLSYNSGGTDLAQIEFTYEASSNTGRNSGYVLDNIMVTGF